MFSVLFLLNIFERDLTLSKEIFRCQHDSDHWKIVFHSSIIFAVYMFDTFILSFRDKRSLLSVVLVDRHEA